MFQLLFFLKLIKRCYFGKFQRTPSIYIPLKFLYLLYIYVEMPGDPSSLDSKILHYYVMGKSRKMHEPRARVAQFTII